MSDLALLEADRAHLAPMLLPPEAPLEVFGAMVWVEDGTAITRRDGRVAQARE
jgi:hypothetical protein